MDEVPPGGEDDLDSSSLPDNWKDALRRTGYRWLPGDEDGLGYVHSQLLRRGMSVARMLRNFTPERWVDHNTAELELRDEDPVSHDRFTARMVWRGRWLKLGCYTLLAWTFLGWLMVDWRYWLGGLAMLLIVQEAANKLSHPWKD